MKKIFITFEGIEGAGKSTQIRWLADTLIKNGFEVCMTREPGGTLIGDEVRRILVQKGSNAPSPLTELFLFEAARVEHVNQIILPALSSGKVVLCDRFTDATIAYQGFGRGISLEEIKSLNQMAAQGIMPTKTILLDISPEAGLARVKERLIQGTGEKNRLDEETILFYNNVRAGYLTLAKSEPNRFHVIDASLKEKIIALKIFTVCQDLFEDCRLKVT